MLPKSVQYALSCFKISEIKFLSIIWKAISIPIPTCNETPEALNSGEFCSSTTLARYDGCSNAHMHLNG